MGTPEGDNCVRIGVPSRTKSGESACVCLCVHWTPDEGLISGSCIGCLPTSVLFCHVHEVFCFLMLVIEIALYLVL